MEVKVFMSNSSLMSPKVRNALSQARFFFTREKKKTVFIEGDNDLKLISPFINDDIRLEVLNGKPNILFVESRYLEDKFAIENGYVMIMADVDYDVLLNNRISNYIDYNVFCKDKGILFNDLEVFLINTRALKKIMINYGLYSSDDDVFNLKNELEDASRFFGKYRVADEYFKKEIGGYSILNSFSIDEYVSINGDNITIDKNKFIEQLPLWANRKEYIDDLLLKAESLDSECGEKWSLSNGHDITKILSIYMESKLSEKHNRKVSMKQNQMELILRLSCDDSEYRRSPMGVALSGFGAI